MSLNDMKLRYDCIILIEIMFDDKLEGCGNHDCILTADEFCQKILLGVV